MVEKNCAEVNKRDDARRGVLNLFAFGDGPIAALIDGEPREAEPSEILSSATGLYMMQPAGCIIGVWGMGDEADAPPRLPPSAILSRSDARAYIWALREPAKPADLAAVADVFEPVEAPSPLPGAGGWAVAAVDAGALYTPADLIAIYGAAEAVGGVLRPGERLHDAAVITPFNTRDPRLARMVAISQGRSAKDMRWAPKEVSIGGVLTTYCRHNESANKDGPAWMLADMPAGRREAPRVRGAGFVGLDLDKGTPREVVIGRLKDAGLMAVLHSTFSHMTTESREPFDVVMKFADKSDFERDVTDELLRALWADKGYELEIVESLTVLDVVEGDRGREVILSHAPIPRWRLIVPLLDDFRVSDWPTDQTGRQTWREIPAGLARLLGGLQIDRSGCDINRLFYLPARAPGRPHETYLFGGDFLDWRRLLTDAAAPDRGERKDPMGPLDRRWAARRADGLDIVALLRDHAHDRIRADHGEKLEIECPADFGHSNAGDPNDRGCVAMTGDCGFVITCRHDSCEGLDRLDFLNLMIRDGWIDEAVVRSDAYDAVIREDESAATAADLDAMIAALTPESSDDEIERVAFTLADAGLSPIAQDRKEATIQARLKVTKRTVERTVKAAIAQRRAEAEAGGAVGAEVKPPTWFTPPPKHLGEFVIRGVASRRWICAGTTPLTTLFSLLKGVRYPDRGEAGGDCGLRIAFENEHGREALIDLDAADVVRVCGTPAMERLRSGGVLFTDAGRNFLVSYLRETQPPGVELYDRAGWRGDAFILPTGAALLTNRDVGLSERARLKCRANAGSLDGWREAADYICSLDAPSMQAGLALGAVGPLVDLLGFDSPAFAFVGVSSKSKSTAIQIAGALWADPGLGDGLVIPLNATEAGLEGPLERSSGTFFGGDEDRQIGGGAEALQKLVFAIQGGAGKRRGTPRGGEQRVRRWRTAVAFTGETGIGQKLTAAGATRANGLSARLMEINVDEGAADIAPEDWSRVEAALQNFGWAGPTFIQALSDLGYIADPDRLKAEIKERQARLDAHAVPIGLGASQRRIRQRLARLPALLWTAAEIMRSADLLPAAFDAWEMVSRLWEWAQESDLAPADPLSRAIAALREGVAAGVTAGTITEGGEDEPGRRDPDGFIDSIPAAKLRAINEARKAAGHEPITGEVYLIRAQRLAQLAGDTVPDLTLRKALVAEDIAVPVHGSARGEIGWDGWPGRAGRMRFIVLRRECIDWIDDAGEWPEAANDASGRRDLGAA